MTINSLKRKTSIGNRFRYGRDFGIIRPEFKITMIKRPKAFMEKVDNVKEQMSTLRREVKTVKIKRKY